MGVCFLSALMIATPLFNSVPCPPALATFIQVMPAPKGYGDSPRPFPVSRLHMTESLAEQHLLKKVEPEYPPEAKASDLKEAVIFRIVIGKNGGVKEIHLRRGKPLLIEPAAKAISNWQYEPFMLNGKAVEVDTFATVRLALPGKHQ